MVHLHNCPKCNSLRLNLIHKVLDHFVSGEIYEIHKCEACGFSFTQDYPEEDIIGSYYNSEEYISHSDDNTGFINQVYHFIRDFMLRSKYRMISNIIVKKNANLLDIGCGTGYFPAYMKSKGWTVTGIEINEKAREFASTTFGLDIKNPGHIEKLKNKYFDCITMWHVLEHFHNPALYLDSAFRILDDNGIIIIALPNSDSFDARYYKEFWAAWDVPRHLWHFNPANFESYISDFGFSVKKTKRLPFDAFYVSILSERYKKKNFAFFRGFLIGSISWGISLLNKNRTSSVAYIIEKKRP